MTRKIIKIGKWLFLVVIVLGVVIYVKSLFVTGQGIDISHKTATYTGLSYIKDSGVVNKELVFKSLSNVHQLVGLEGHAEKTYTYTDSLFHGSGWLKDHLGRRTIQFDLDVFFKTGIDLSNVTQDDVKVIGNSLFIKIPKHMLISLDVPYDQIIFKKQTGLLRDGLSESEQQNLYSEIRRLITKDILTDSSIEQQTRTGIEDALRSLLEKIPNVNRVVFQVK
jgi:hypothetical protein